jgi:hypothetical protein
MYVSQKPLFFLGPFIIQGVQLLQTRQSSVYRAETKKLDGRKFQFKHSIAVLMVSVVDATNCGSPTLIDL